MVPVISEVKVSLCVASNADGAAEFGRFGETITIPVTMVFRAPGNGRHDSRRGHFANHMVESVRNKYVSSAIHRNAMRAIYSASRSSSVQPSFDTRLPDEICEGVRGVNRLGAEIGDHPHGTKKEPHTQFEIRNSHKEHVELEMQWHA
jgi:hypothetical protein